ncbi:hypothetical protein IFM47457_10764 [Aspergillus lentulus]|nr:hypothetical protein IFM47457_10764 [Aspergillus lentulus]
MHNASFHHSERIEIRADVFRSGCEASALPPYSQDLNPIEDSLFAGIGRHTKIIEARDSTPFSNGVLTQFVQARKAQRDTSAMRF